MSINSALLKRREERGKRILYDILHIIVLALSIFLVVSISIDTFKNIAFYRAPHFLKVQFWICIVFLCDFFLEWIMAEKKGHYFATHFFFLLVAIPYLPIIDFFNWTFSPKLYYLLQYIPLVRGGYALAIVVGWFSYNKATGLFFTYLFTLLATVYFSSLVFYVFEKHVNKLVTVYTDALWWAAMDVTTVGSNIVAVTPEGRVLSVVLAALGMMMFPIFTVYVTSLIQKNKNTQPPAVELIDRGDKNDETTNGTTIGSSATPSPAKPQNSSTTPSSSTAATSAAAGNSPEDSTKD
ncbi:MAG: potassium channel family protein [Muribaculaceae bacterium]|nr:potassium channel family protein [Muribaculaceae bacterium]